MAVENLVGTPRRLVKFVSLVIGLLMAGAIVVCLLYAQLLLALASAIISAWALLVFTETLKSEIAEMLRSPGAGEGVEVSLGESEESRG